MPKSSKLDEDAIYYAEKFMQKEVQWVKIAVVVNNTQYEVRGWYIKGFEDSKIHVDTPNKADLWHSIWNELIFPQIEAVRKNINKQTEITDYVPKTDLQRPHGSEEEPPKEGN